jgi:hypothetical protein
MKEKTKPKLITILPSVESKGEKKAKELFNTNRSFSKYITYLINNDNDR